MDTRELVLGSMFTALACIAAVILRFSGSAMVPYSLLPLIVFLAGLLLRPKAATMAFTAYLILGLAGVPVFAKAPYGGPAYVVQPTFGFLLSFPPAAALISLIRGQSQAITRLMAAAMAGILTIYIIGAVYLAVIVNYYLGSPMSAIKVMQVAVAPFMLIDLIKAMVAVILARQIFSRMKL